SIWTTGVRRAWRVSGQGWQGGAAVAPAAGYYAAITVPGTGPGGSEHRGLQTVYRLMIGWCCGRGAGLVFSGGNR
ncbi:MAG: hypothetical protein KAY71_04520, partial [Chromatiaceae bacterium]|nr:hypothetical protein [Chromatiaceae bacterium]